MEMSYPYDNVAALMAYHALGLKLGFISNANSLKRTDRARSLADMASGELDEPIEVVTSLLVGGKKKPRRKVFDRMAEVLDLPNDRLCYFGDQLLKDVLGANWAGYGGTVLVTPYGRGDDPGVKYLQRPLEAAIRPFIGLPLRTKKFKANP